MTTGRINQVATRDRQAIDAPEAHRQPDGSTAPLTLGKHVQHTSAVNSYAYRLVIRCRGSDIEASAARLAVPPVRPPARHRRSAELPIWGLSRAAARTAPPSPLLADYPDRPPVSDTSGSEATRGRPALRADTAHTASCAAPAAVDRTKSIDSTRCRTDSPSLEP